MNATDTSIRAGELPLRASMRLYPYDRWPDVDAMIDVVAHADRLGYYALSFPEHFVTLVSDTTGPAGKVWFDNFVLGATLASATSRIRMLFNVCVVPYRHPVELAKLVATLDVVSDGRVILVAGTGWARDEFRLLGIPYEERGPRTDEALRAMKVLWTQSRPSYEGQFFSIPPVHFLPQCIQQPHVPIWVGGNGKRPMRRAVELGDGWSPLGGTFDEVTSSISLLRDQLESAGRDPKSFAFTYLLPFGEPDAASRQALSSHLAGGRELPEAKTMGVDQTVDLIGRCREAGVNHFVLQVSWDDPQHYKEMLERFATDVLGQLQPG